MRPEILTQLGYGQSHFMFGRVSRVGEEGGRAGDVGEGGRGQGEGPLAPCPATQFEEGGTTRPASLSAFLYRLASPCHQAAHHTPSPSHEQRDQPPSLLAEPGPLLF